MLASALTFASAVLGGAPPAHAVPAPDIPPECGARASFDRELSKRLGDDTLASSVRVTITPAAGQYHLRVQIGSELRELDDPSCTELFRASLVVAVAMLLHDAQLAPASPASPASPRKPAPPSEYPRFTLGVGAGVALGTLPHPVLALELESKAFWRHLGLSASLRYLAPTQKVDDQAKKVELQALGAGVAGLFRPSRRWEARLGFAVQRLNGEGGGSIAKGHQDSVWVAGPTLGLAFIPFQRGPFWAGLGAEGQLNAVRGSFQIIHYSRDVTGPPYEIYPVPWLAGSAFVRLGLVW